MNENNSLAHTKWNCKYHIVFAPKYRRKLFYGENRKEIGGILSRTFERANKVKIRRYNPFKVRIKAHCAALFPRWSVKSIAASNNLKA